MPDFIYQIYSNPEKVANEFRVMTMSLNFKNFTKMINFAVQFLM